MTSKERGCKRSELIEVIASYCARKKSSFI